MRRIQVVTVQVPQLLSDIVHAILGAEPDMQVRSHEGSEGEIGAALDLEADVVIFGDAECVSVERLLAVVWRRPQVKVIALEPSGRSAQLYELRPRRSALGELSPISLPEAIRSAVRGQGA